MYQFSYAEIMEDGVADAKERERQALTRSIELLVAARDDAAAFVASDGQIRGARLQAALAARQPDGRLPRSSAGLARSCGPAPV